MARRRPHRRPGRRDGGARRRCARTWAIRRRTARWRPPARTVKVVRPAAGEPPLDDVNWFARPVPNAKGDWIVAVASHNLNYLYNLTTGVRVRIPDKSDAVATPDGRYITVPSHYTAANTVSFYDAATLLERLAAGRDAADVQAGYEHRHADVHDVYYQSVGVAVADDQRRPRDDRLPDDVLGLDHAQDARLPRGGLHVHAPGRPADGHAHRADAAVPADHPRPGHAVHLQGRPLRRRPRRLGARPAGLAQDLRDHRHRSGGAVHVV